MRLNRLKIKCNKQIPCESCVRRGCSALCPNGVLATGQCDTRSDLSVTENLHRELARIEECIRTLEGALTVLHANGTVHPLLVDGEDFSAGVNDPQPPNSTGRIGEPWEVLDGPSDGKVPATSSGITRERELEDKRSRGKRSELCGMSAALTVGYTDFQKAIKGTVLNLLFQSKFSIRLVIRHYRTMQFNTLLIATVLAAATQAFAQNALNSITWYAGADCTGAQVQASIDSTPGECISSATGAAKSILWQGSYTGESLQVYDSTGAACTAANSQVAESGINECITAHVGFNVGSVLLNN
ncbi:Zn(2)-C6 fungal-type domain-containing protein [Mycena sanguinolenta]|uniref:Zn(2)-C6 fungal-type domain-containing protein n=1 Tax=Mycena sanguinolenta TaxID=230812 RepID=A0A8H6ZD49_9AGAR|nr:Zn(2)-C6 fungal-type domain-containing protein [Mycena sanguinolenta]